MYSFFTPSWKINSSISKECNGALLMHGWLPASKQPPTRWCLWSSEGWLQYLSAGMAPRPSKYSINQTMLDFHIFDTPHRCFLLWLRKRVENHFLVALHRQQPTLYCCSLRPNWTCRELQPWKARITNRDLSDEHNEKDSTSALWTLTMKPAAADDGYGGNGISKSCISNKL